MSFFDDQTGRFYTELSAEQVIYYRGVMETHANLSTSGVCAICREPRCPDWRDAYERLAAAGQIMATPERWATGYDNRSKRW